jgi:rod shape-determining protein MreC
MKWVANLPLRNRRVLFLFVGLLLALILISLKLQQKAFVCRLIQTGIYQPFWYLAARANRFLDVYEVNTDLQAELVRLKLERRTYEESKLENEQFREMLELLPKPEYDVVPALVFAYDQGRRHSSLTIKASEKLERFLPVVNQNGLVGRIGSASDKVATVSLLVGPMRRVAARDQRTRSLGIVKWQAGRGLYLDDVAFDNQVNVGDTLISSGLGGVFPEGLVIGVVTSVGTSPSGFFQKIRVRPAVDFGSLDNVMVLRPRAGRYAE